MNSTFFKFFFGFVAIITVAFGVLVTAGLRMQSLEAVDNVAGSR